MWSFGDGDSFGSKAGAPALGIETDRRLLRADTVIFPSSDASKASVGELIAGGDAQRKQRANRGKEGYPKTADGCTTLYLNATPDMHAVYKCIFCRAVCGQRCVPVALSVPPAAVTDH